MKRFSPIKAGRKLGKDLFLKKKLRKFMKKMFLKTQRNILENSDFTIKPILKHEFAERQLETSVLAFTVTGLETIKKAEEFEKNTTLENCKFKLFQKIGGSSVIIRGDFFKPLKNENKIVFVYFPKGLPKNGNKKTFIYKDKYEFDGYKLIDEGSFKQKILNFEEFSITCRGKVFNKRIILKTIGDSTLEYWSRISEVK